MPIAQEIGKEKRWVLHSFFSCKANDLLQTCNNGYFPLYKIEIALVLWKDNMLLFLHKGVSSFNGS